ncbi:MAG: DNA-packaging protein [Polyangiaceae bacterium]|nr:DNA-packaging protein [Polyangiaceae bacterium]
MRPLADVVADALAKLGPELAVREAAAWLAGLTISELAALGADWEHTWARPSQLLPAGPWRSFGFLTARRVGKTRSLSEYVNREAMAGRAMRIGFMAQTEDKALEVMVHGEAGLIACSSPKFPARFESGRVVWPNGAQAFPFTPEVPGGIRGPGVHLFWASELQSWPVATREEAWHNASLVTSLGYAKTVWDATPKRRHPILRMLLARAAADPELHHVVRGSIRENADNLGAGVIDDLHAAMGGTRRGQEELEGVFFDNDEDALFRAEWFDKTRRNMPSTFTRRIYSVDPAITSDPRFSDQTGIVGLGLGVDEQIYITSNATGVHRPEVWPGLVVDRYVREGCDLIVIETNRGGNTHVALLRIACRERGLTLIELGPQERPTARSGVVYVRAHYTKGTKADRAAAAASVVERGRVSMVNGAELGDLEERLCEFTGDGKGPDDAIDAFVHGVYELARLSDSRPNATAAFKGLAEANQRLAEAGRRSERQPMAGLFARPGAGRTI